MSTRLSLRSASIWLIVLGLSACSKNHKSTKDIAAVEAGTGDADGEMDDDDWGDDEEETTVEAGAAPVDADSGGTPDAGGVTNVADAASAADAQGESDGGAATVDAALEAGTAASGGDGGAQPSDAGARADAATTPGNDEPSRVSCLGSGGQSQTCTTPAQVCCPGQGCQAAAMGCAAISVSCDGPEDCASGKVCCANGASLACADACTTAEICHDRLDCDPGEACFDVAGQLGVCVPDFSQLDAGVGFTRDGGFALPEAGFPRLDGGFNFPWLDGGFSFPWFDGGFSFPGLGGP